MPEPVIAEKPVAETNAETIAKAAAQDLAGHSMAPEETADTSGALDAIVAKREEEKAEAPVIPDPKPEVLPDKPDIKVEAEAALVVKETPTPEEEARRKRAEDVFKDAPGLPPGASPKSSEAFAAIKIKAAQELSAREKLIDDLKKEKADLEEKLKNPVPAELEKELADHREWRAKLDVESDPKFKEFDKSIQSSREFIYAQLKRYAISDEVIAQIKKHGGPEMVKMDKIYESMSDPMTQRIIDARIAEIEQIKWSKEEAIKSTKANIAQYIDERHKAAESTYKAHNDATEKQFSAFASTLDWFADKTVDPKGDKAVREEAEAHNKFIAETKSQLKAAFEDDSPYMRALLLTGMAQLLRLQKVHEGVKTKLEASETALKEATEKLGRFKEASVSRLRQSGAAPGGKTADMQAKPEDLFNKRAGDSIDDIAKNIMETRAAAGK